MTPPRQTTPEHFRAFYILPGTRIGTYFIREAIGQGGAQMAYLADASDGREVVLKMSLFPKGQEGSANRTMHERFLRQVIFFLQLRGTLGVARIFAHDMFPDHSESGHAYLVQEWIPGSINLLDWYREKPHKLKKILAGCIILADACAEMMRRGICHRDLKPENILVTPEGFPKIVDFDSGRGIGAEPLTTQAGGWPGTGLYYSPEVCQAFLSNPTSVPPIPYEDLFAGDLHALGVIFYQVLTGKHPFDENAPLEKLLDQIAHEVPVRPSALNPEVPFGLDKVTMRLLEKDPGQRYRFGDEVVADLKRLLKTREDWERPFQTPTSRTSPGTPPPTPRPRTSDGSAALDLAPAAIVLASPRALVVRGPRALLCLEPLPSALASCPRPAETASVEPAPRPSPQRRLALLLATALGLALVVSSLSLGQHADAGSFVERGTMLLGQVKTAVIATSTMVLTACAGLTGKVRTGEDDWLATCSPESRKTVSDLGLDPDIGVAEVLEGPNVIIPDDGGLELRDGPVEVSALIPARGGGVVCKLSGVIRTGSDGASLHFDKLQLFNGSEPEHAPPAGRILNVCAFASVRGYRADPGIPKVTEDLPPASELHPGFVFVTTGALEIHFAH